MEHHKIFLIISFTQESIKIQPKAAWHTPSNLSMLRVQSIPPAYVPRGLACSLTLTVSKGNPVKMLAAPATPPLRALTVLSAPPTTMSSQICKSVLAAQKSLKSIESTLEIVREHAGADKTKPHRLPCSCRTWSADRSDLHSLQHGRL